MIEAPLIIILCDYTTRLKKRQTKTGITIIFVFVIAIFVVKYCYKLKNIVNVAGQFHVYNILYVHELSAIVL